MKFTGTGPKQDHWTWAVDTSGCADSTAVKHDQLIKAGARLAQLLNTIWP